MKSKVSLNFHEATLEERAIVHLIANEKIRRQLTFFCRNDEACSPDCCIESNSESSSNFLSS